MDKQQTRSAEAVLDIAMQAQYLLQGYGDCRFPSPMSERQLMQGHLAVTQRLAELAVVVHDFLLTPPMRAHVEAGNWPGVWEYEVAENLGLWFRTHSLCTEQQFLAELEGQAREWFDDSQVHA